MTLQEIERVSQRASITTTLIDQVFEKYVFYVPISLAFGSVFVV